MRRAQAAPRPTAPTSGHHLRGTPTWRALAGTLLVALTISGCTSDGSDERPEPDPVPAATWEQVELPASTAAAGPAVAMTDVLGAAGGQPAVLVGTQAESGAPAQARAWTPEGEEWQWTELPAGDGHAAVTDAFTADGTTWVTGTRTTPGAGSTAFLVSSADRGTWQAVDLPDDPFEPGAGVPTEDGVLLLGTAEDFTPVAVTPGKDPARTSLPLPDGDQEFRGFVGATLLGEDVVALARVGPPGAPDRTALYRSPDGRRWTVGPGPDGNGIDVQDLVAAGSTLVVTGRVQVGAGTSPTAWSSADGTTWTQEGMPSLDRSPGFTLLPDDDAWVGRPAVQGDRVVAVVSASSELDSAVVVRDPAGTWTLSTHTSLWVIPGAGVVPAWNEDGTTLLAQSGAGAARVWKADATGQRTGWATFGTLDHGLRWTRLSPGPEQSLLVGSRSEVTLNRTGGWERTSTSSPYVLPATGPVQDGSWDPAEAGQLFEPLHVTAADGSQLVLGNVVVREPDGTPNVNLTGWHRSGPDTAWTPFTGLQTRSTEFVEDVAKVADLWLAVGSARPSFNILDQSRAAVWSSSDGVAWTRHEGAFSTGEVGDSWAEAVCALPSGAPLLVGGADAADGQVVPRGWTVEAGRWTPLPTSALGDRGTVESCTDDGEATLLQGTLDGRATVWRTTDGQTFSATPIGERGDVFSPVRAVEGGFVATGSRSRLPGSGPVVWLSADGTEWAPLAIPSDKPLTGVDVVAQGTALVVVANGPTAPEVWRLADYSEHLPQE